MNITQSALRAYIECPKKALLKLAGIRPKQESNKAYFGTVWHELMELWFKYHEDGMCLAKLEESTLSDHDKSIMKALFDAWVGQCRWADHKVK